ncbi:MAG: putative metal-binding motif-containing protein [Myxococcota bacterium]|jgi:hypothetical protein|nr:putative metal-binding motif-containing protein [Myxococcota bacterium]
MVKALFLAACLPGYEPPVVPGNPEHDWDGDGYTEVEGDCDDEVGGVYPGADEVCDGIDNDCDGDLDGNAIDIRVWYLDEDGDGLGGDQGLVYCTRPDGYSANSDDCDDTDPDILGPDTWYPDTDEDGYGDQSIEALSCDVLAGYVTQGGDCDDTDPAITPGSDEVCDGIDNDCDSVVDEDESVDARTWYYDEDCDMYGDASISSTSCEEPESHVENGDDCDDADTATNPDVAEICCDGIDNDCDGDVDGDDESCQLDLSALECSVDTCPSDSLAVVTPVGAAFCGGDLWVVDGSGDLMIQVDTTDGVVLSVDEEYSFSSVTCIDEQVWAVSGSNDQLYVYEDEAWQSQAQLTNHLRGLASDGTDLFIWDGADPDFGIFRASTDGSSLERWDSDIGDAGDLEYVDGWIWAAQPYQAAIFDEDLSDPDVVEFSWLDGPEGMAALAYDGTCLWQVESRSARTAVYDHDGDGEVFYALGGEDCDDDDPDQAGSCR